MTAWCGRFPCKGMREHAAGREVIDGERGRADFLAVDVEVDRNDIDGGMIRGDEEFNCVAGKNFTRTWDSDFDGATCRRFVFEDNGGGLPGGGVDGVSGQWAGGR